MTWCVYIYYDPKGCIPRYVGKSQSEDRAWSHLKKSHNRQLHRMLQKRAREGFTIEPQIIHHIDQCQDGVNDLEIALIAMLGRQDKNAGPLFNKTDGGDGSTGYVYTPEQRKKQARFPNNHMLGRTHTTEVCKRMALGHTGYKHTDEARERMSLAKKGKPNLRLQGQKHPQDLCARRGLAIKEALARKKAAKALVNKPC